MPLEGSYAIWNNRGGTGKTTLVYHLANKYALKHPDKTVLLIDMCPQADLSHAFLGDDENQMDYVSQLGTLKKDSMIIGEHKIPKTVSGYLDLSMSLGLPNNVDPRTFLINVSKFNPQLPRNLYLLCGDASIELVARSLEQKRDQHASLSPFGQYAWKAVTSAIKQFIKKIAERKGIKLVVFIDLNSSFSIITEIGLAASDKLLIPITEDHLHRDGFEYMFALLYGFSHPSNVYYYYRHFSFYYRANEHDVKLPKIHLILNKCTTETIEAGPFGSNKNESEWEFIFDLYKKHPQAFHLSKQRQQAPPQTLEEFKQLFVIDICEQVSTNQIVRQAVRSHSPLLSIKHPHNSNTNPNANASNAATKTTTTTTTTMTTATATNNSTSSSSGANTLFNNNNNKINTITSNTTTNSNNQTRFNSSSTSTSPVATSSNMQASCNTAPPTPKIVRSASPSPASLRYSTVSQTINSSHAGVSVSVNISNATAASSSYPLQHQNHISRVNKNLLFNAGKASGAAMATAAVSTSLNSRNDSLGASLLANDENSSLERTNAVLFDKILDKIVDMLVYD
jgi:cellulose biosynthesis protein BcsQ